MQIEELEGQKRLRTEMIRVEDSHAHMCKEYEMLRIEFEQAMAANDQNGVCEYVKPAKIHTHTHTLIFLALVAFTCLGR